MARKPSSPSAARTADTYVLALIKSHPNLLVPHFLVHSFLYYVMDSAVIQDATFDVIVKTLGEKWDTVEHPHKHLIDPSLLKSGFYLKYPSIVEGAAHSFLREFTR